MSFFSNHISKPLKSFIHNRTNNNNPGMNQMIREKKAWTTSQLGSRSFSPTKLSPPPPKTSISITSSVKVASAPSTRYPTLEHLNSSNPMARYGLIQLWGLGFLISAQCLLTCLYWLNSQGRLEDGRDIAVKKLSQTSNQGKKEFMNEAKLLARVQHRNVVNLLGYCIHGSEKLLVYEYLPHQSLDKFLFNSRKRGELDWKKRYDVIAGVTRGLRYLHEECHISIIHRDIKASNILLDDKWVPKIADFGMARLFPEDETHVNTRVAGTNGYMAPEYVLRGRLSAKADVYSFGVLVLELISGQKNSSFNRDKDAANLLEWAWKLYMKGRGLEIVDVVIASEAASEQVETCLKIGLLCVQGDPDLRPTMNRVTVMLSRKSGINDEPTKPGYSGYKHRRAGKHTGSSSTSGTADSFIRPATSSFTKGSTGESSKNFDAAFNASSSNTSTMRRTSQEKHSTSTSTVTRAPMEHSSGS